MSVLKSNILPTLTRVLKDLLYGSLTFVGVILYRAGLCRLVTRLNRRAPKVLMLHSCEETETGFTRGLAINTTPSQFCITSAIPVALLPDYPARGTDALFAARVRGRDYL